MQAFVAEACFAPVAEPYCLDLRMITASIARASQFRWNEEGSSAVKAGKNGDTLSDMPTVPDTAERTGVSLLLLRSEHQSTTSSSMLSIE